MVIHPNRWFIWTLFLLLIASFILLFFIEKAIIDFERDAAETSFSYTSGWKTFRSDVLGFAVSYPSSWQIEIDPLEENTVAFENPENFGENISISVVDPSLELTIRRALEIGSESETTVDDHIGTWIKSSNKSDIAVSNVILVEANDELYYIAGSANLFDRVLASMKFLSK